VFCRLFHAYHEKLHRYAFTILRDNDLAEDIVQTVFLKFLQLIGKYLSGEASPEEAAAIDSWRTKSSENNRIFESTARLWEESAATGRYRKPQNSANWLKLKRNFQAGPEQSPSFIKKLFLTPWKVAAVILLSLGIAALFYLLLSRSPQVTYNKIARTKKTVVKDTLPDASVITLSRNSSLSIQDRFARTGRTVKLEGEGYFSVKPVKDRPFVIYTGGIKITVLGTAFNVKNEPKKVTVGVSHGKVKLQKDSSGILVTAGSTGIFHKTDKRFVLHPDSLNRNAYSYATGELYFNKASMEEVKDVLENTYGINVYFKKETLNNLRLNTQFKDRPLDYVLKVIGASLRIQYDLKDDTLYFFKKESK